MNLANPLRLLFATSILLTTAFAEPTPFTTDAEIEQGNDPLLYYWEKSLGDASRSLSPFSSPALLTATILIFAGMNMPLTTALTIGLSNLASVSAEPIPAAPRSVTKEREARFTFPGFEGTQLSAASTLSTSIQTLALASAATLFSPLITTLILSAIHLPLVSAEPITPTPPPLGLAEGADELAARYTYPGFEGTQLSTASSSMGSIGVAAMVLLVLVGVIVGF